MVKPPAGADYIDESTGLLGPGRHYAARPMVFETAPTEAHAVAAHLDLARFAAGRTIDERGVGPFPYLH